MSNDDPKALAERVLAYDMDVRGPDAHGQAVRHADAATLAREVLRLAPKIDWTQDRKDRCRSFLEGHRLAMMHCDEEIGENGRCECMERLAETWVEWEQERDALREALENVDVALNGEDGSCTVCGKDDNKHCSACTARMWLRAALAGEPTPSDDS